jgi:hypothetical protein
MVSRIEVPTLVGPGTELRAREGVHTRRNRTVAIGEDQLARGGDQPTCQRAEGGAGNRNDCRSDRRPEPGADGGTDPSRGGLCSLLSQTRDRLFEGFLGRIRVRVTTVDDSVGENRGLIVCDFDTLEIYGGPEGAIVEVARASGLPSVPAYQRRRHWQRCFRGIP